MLTLQGEERTGRVDKPAEAELRIALAEAEARLAAILDAAPLPIVTLDTRGRVTSWSKAAEQMFGWTEAEVLGRRSPTIPEADLPASDAMLARVLGGETFSGLERLRRQKKDGSPIDISIFTAPLRDAEGNTTGSLLLVEDITEQVRVRDETSRLLALQQISRRSEEAAQQRLVFLAEAAAILASSLDYEATLSSVARLAVPAIGDWCVVHVVQEHGEVQQVAVQHVDPAKVKLAERWSKEYPFDPGAPAGVALVIRTGMAELMSEIPDELLESATDDPQLLATLRSLGLKSSIVAPMIARRRTIGAITIVSAESGRHYSEDDLALAEGLAERAALAVDNARLYRAAQQAIVQKDEFLSAAAHDLKNPLATVKTMAQLLHRRAERSESPEARAFSEGLARIDSTATRMAGLVDELLDAARIQMDHALDLERKPADLVALVREVVADQQATTDRHELHFCPATGELTGCWDAARVDRMVANLVANAVKYSPGGTDIRVAVSREDDHAVITVTDHGMGIPEADLPRIFDRFYRASNATGHVPGTGIGLAGAKRIAEQHGGSIAVSSEVGRGSTFTVRLPLQPEPPANDAPPAGVGGQSHDG